MESVLRQTQESGAQISSWATVDAEPDQGDRGIEKITRLKICLDEIRESHDSKGKAQKNFVRKRGRRTLLKS